VTDQQIIQAALDAGLCFPDCWQLVDLHDPQRDISDEWMSREREQMGKLRRFAESLQANV
jgi:hypothetical protein